MGVGDEKLYEFFARQVEYKNEKIIQTFELYIKLMVVLGGGVIWLGIADVPKKLLEMLVFPIHILFGIVGFGSILLISLNLESWFGFRQRLQIFDKTAPPPSFARCYAEIFMVLAILIITVGAMFYAEKILLWAPKSLGV